MTDVSLRARAAIAALTLAFNPHQRRGPDGRWVKMGGEAAPKKAAARPSKKTRVKARPADSAANWLDVLRRGDDMPPEVERQIRDTFAYEDPQTGFHSEVLQVKAQGGSERPSYFVIVSIKDSDGLEVGRATRSIWPVEGDPTRISVHHGSFLLGKRAQRGGFSSRWLAQMEDRYRERGISRITLFTDSVGGYAWAKAGFDFESPNGARHIATQLGRRLKMKKVRQGLPQRVIADGEELIRRTQSKDPQERPTPMEFAMLGWTPGATSWVGKEAMLDTGWAAVKQL